MNKLTQLYGLDSMQAAEVADIVMKAGRYKQAASQEEGEMEELGREDALDGVRQIRSIEDLDPEMYGHFQDKQALIDAYNRGYAAGGATDGYVQGRRRRRQAANGIGPMAAPDRGSGGGSVPPELADLYDQLDKLDRDMDADRRSGGQRRNELMAREQDLLEQVEMFEENSY